MATPTRWTAVAAVSWRPVLTFTRRRLDLVDRIEASGVPVTSFTDAPDHFGVATKSDSQRLRVERSGLRVELRGREADVAALSQAGAYAFELFQDADPLPAFYSATWSMGLSGSYADMTRRLAQQASGPIPADVAVSTDCAILLDLKTAAGPLKVEYGVVSRGELEGRLADANVGRLGAAVGVARPEVHGLEVSSLPEVSLYVEAFCVASADAVLRSFDQFATFLDVNDSLLHQVVYSLATRLGSE